MGDRNARTWVFACGCRPESGNKFPHSICGFAAAKQGRKHPIHLLALRACMGNAAARISSKRKRVGPLRTRNKAPEAPDPLAGAACLYGGRGSAYKLEAQASGSVKDRKQGARNTRSTCWRCVLVWGTKTQGQVMRRGKQVGGCSLPVGADLVVYTSLGCHRPVCPERWSVGYRQSPGSPFLRCAAYGRLAPQTATRPFCNRGIAPHGRLASCESRGGLVEKIVGNAGSFSFATRALRALFRIGL